MEKPNMFQARFVKIDEFGWWDIEVIQTGAVAHSTSKDFQECIYVPGVQLSLAAPDHQEINVQV